MKKLYSGFDLKSPTTSVSMTINGPAPIILAMYMNTAIDQQVERYLKENGQWEEAKKRIENHFKELNAEQPAYLEKLPGNHNSFGRSEERRVGKEGKSRGSTEA